MKTDVPAKYLPLIVKALEHYRAGLIPYGQVDCEYQIVMDIFKGSEAGAASDHGEKRSTRQAGLMTWAARAGRTLKALIRTGAFPPVEDVFGIIAVPTIPAVADEARLRELLAQTFAYSNGEINELRELSINVCDLGPDWRDRAQFRAAIETISAVSRFDKTGFQLLRRANRTRKRALLFAVTAAILSAAALWISYLSFEVARK